MLILPPLTGLPKGASIRNRPPGSPELSDLLGQYRRARQRSVSAPLLAAECHRNFGVGRDDVRHAPDPRDYVGREILASEIRAQRRRISPHDALRELIDGEPRIGNELRQLRAAGVGIGEARHAAQGSAARDSERPGDAGGLPPPH